MYRAKEKVSQNYWLLSITTIKPQIVPKMLQKTKITTREPERKKLEKRRSKEFQSSKLGQCLKSYKFTTEN